VVRQVVKQVVNVDAGDAQRRSSCCCMQTVVLAIGVGAPMVVAIVTGVLLAP